MISPSAHGTWSHVPRPIRDSQLFGDKSRRRPSTSARCPRCASLCSWVILETERAIFVPLSLSTGTVVWCAQASGEGKRCDVHREAESPAASRCVKKRLTASEDSLPARLNEIAAAIRPCTPQFAAMLACWSATNDIMSTSACADSAKALLTCMRTAVSIYLFSDKAGVLSSYLAARAHTEAQADHQLPSCTPGQDSELNRRASLLRTHYVLTTGMVHEPYIIRD